MIQNKIINQNQKTKRKRKTNSGKHAMLEDSRGSKYPHYDCFSSFPYRYWWFDYVTAGEVSFRSCFFKYLYNKYHATWCTVV